jgi:hypothetical protein
MNFLISKKINNNRTQIKIKLSNFTEISLKDDIMIKVKQFQ